MFIAPSAPDAFLVPVGLPRHIVLRDLAELDEHWLQMTGYHVGRLVEVIVGVEDGIRDLGLEHGVLLSLFSLAFGVAQRCCIA